MNKNTITVDSVSNLWKAIMPRGAKIAAFTALLLIGTAALSGTTQAADVLQKAVPVSEITQALKKDGGVVFPIGQPNTTYQRYFTGKSYVQSLSNGGVPMFNVTFSRGAHTYWHIHHKTCQILVAESGRGYYQIWGEPVKELRPGDVVTIPEGVKHWHGAAPNSMFQHIAIMEPVKDASTEWLEAVDADSYNALK